MAEEWDVPLPLSDPVDPVDAVMDVVYSSAPYTGGTPEECMEFFAEVVQRIKGESWALAETTDAELPWGLQ